MEGLRAGGTPHPGNLLRGQETEFLGARPLRDFAQGEQLIASDFLKPSDPKFLAAVLKPGYRAISISVDPPQSVAGMAFPGDYVDVLLTQSFADTGDPGHKIVGETVLRNVEVIATDQATDRPSAVVSTVSTVSTEARIPKTITLEVLEGQAEAILVAEQLGKFQLALRPLEGSGAALPEDKREDKLVWASDVSSALNNIEQPNMRRVSIRIYSGQPKSDGYLCTKIGCVPSDINTVTPEIQTQIPARGAY
jgi:pilus assembly protein CpaB